MAAEYIYVMLILGSVIGLGLFLSRVIKKTKLPALILFIGLGLLMGLLFRFAGLGNFTDYDLGNVVCSIALVFIIFYGGFGTNFRAAKPILWKAITLSSLGTALTALITGSLIYLIFLAIPLMELGILESLLLGAVISSTDAASVFNILRHQKLGLKENTASLLEMESGSNDPMSYILTFLFVVLIAAERGIAGYESVGAPQIVGAFFAQLGFGLVFGVLIGFLGSFLLKRFTGKFKESSVIFIFAMAVLSYAIPSSLPGLWAGNGYLSAYLAGIIIGNSKIKYKKENVLFFDNVTEICQIVIFFLLGLLATPEYLVKIEVIVPSIVLFLLLTLISRPASVFLLLTPFRSSLKQMSFVSLAGLRGVASVVFASFAISTLGENNLPYDLFSIIFLVSLLSLLFQGATLPFLARKIGIDSLTENVMKTFSDYSEETDVSFVEMRIGKHHPFLNKPLRDCGTSKDFLVVLVVRDREAFVPNGNTIILLNDSIIVSAPSFEGAPGVEIEERELEDLNGSHGTLVKDLALAQGEIIALIKRNAINIVPNGQTKLRRGDVLVTVKMPKKEETAMEKPIVYFTKDISREGLIKIYEALGIELQGKVAIKLHSGEKGNQNYVRPEFVKDLVERLNGTVVECNTAYKGHRHTNELHKELLKEHGWDKYFPVQLLDELGDYPIPFQNGKILGKTYVGLGLKDYDSLLILSHFKGHPMGGYGGALKQLSIGLASSRGKSYIHSAGKTKVKLIDWKKDAAPQELFLESMAEAATAVHEEYEGKIAYINMLVNMSVDCDCCAVAEDPCLKDIGLLASTDPVAIDQASLDLVESSGDPGVSHFMERVTSRKGFLTIEKAAELGCGSRTYELKSID